MAANSSPVSPIAEDTCWGHLASQQVGRLVTAARVAFEIDGWDDEGGWSVVLHARAEVVDDDVALERLAKAPLRPWVPTVKPVRVRLRPDEVSGRQFRFGPDREGN